MDVGASTHLEQNSNTEVPITEPLVSVRFEVGGAHYFGSKNTWGVRYKIGSRHLLSLGVIRTS